MHCTQMLLVGFEWKDNLLFIGDSLAFMVTLTAKNLGQINFGLPIIFGAKGLSLRRYKFSLMNTFNAFLLNKKLSVSETLCFQTMEVFSCDFLCCKIFRH